MEVEAEMPGELRGEPCREWYFALAISRNIGV
jgi:hypothetical protein